MEATPPSRPSPLALWPPSSNSTAILAQPLIDLPPNSKPTRFRRLAAACAIMRPVCVLPVKLITGASGESTSSRAPSARDSLKMFTTPRGNSGTLLMISPARCALGAACAGNFITVVQPAAKAGASARIPR